MSDKDISEEYSRLLASVKVRVRAAQYAALKAVNSELVGLFLNFSCWVAF